LNNAEKSGIWHGNYQLYIAWSDLVRLAELLIGYAVFLFVNIYFFLPLIKID